MKVRRIFVITRLAFNSVSKSEPCPPCGERIISKEGVSDAVTVSEVVNALSENKPIASVLPAVPRGMPVIIGHVA